MSFRETLTHRKENFKLIAPELLKAKETLINDPKGSYREWFEEYVNTVLCLCCRFVFLCGQQLACVDNHFLWHSEQWVS